MNKNIYVTKPYLPPLSEFMPYLEEIWKNGILTNNGPMHKELEDKLCDYLGVKYISLFNNGTIALLTALQSLDLSGEIITTPYSFVATTHSVLWNKLTPIFVDINNETLNIDARLIEPAITEKTKGILAVHCYGNPCEVEKIQEIADKYKLKVIYDAAHAFGVRKNNESILNSGDLSVLSFHATKIYNTFEGGAIVSNNESIKQKIDNLKNFGIVDEINITDVGLNGKMSEVNAAFGILQLKHIDAIKEKRKNIAKKYKNDLRMTKGIRLLEEEMDVDYNYSYFPLLVEKEYGLTRNQLYDELKLNKIFTRKYFFPLLSNLSMYQKYKTASKNNLPNANEIANKILCLPIYPDLSNEDVDRIVRIIKQQA